MGTQDDHYAALGIEPTASLAEIKSAYRKLAREMHPDTNPQREAAAQDFAAVARAYEVLSDPARRSAYDALLVKSKHTIGFSSSSRIDGMMSDLFGFNSSSPRPRAGFRQAGPTYRGVASLTLEQAIEGSTVTFHGADGAAIDITVPAGVSEGDTLTFAGKGGVSPTGGQPGDLRVTIKIEPHERLRRVGEELHLLVSAPVDILLLGGELTTVGYRGESLTFKVAPLTSPGEKILLRGRGAPSTDGARGDLFAELRMEMPEKLTPAQEAALKAYRRASLG